MYGNSNNGLLRAVLLESRAALSFSMLVSDSSLKDESLGCVDIGTVDAVLLAESAVIKM